MDRKMMNMRIMTVATVMTAIMAPFIYVFRKDDDPQCQPREW